MKRRDFMRRSALLGAAAFASGSTVSKLLAAGEAPASVPDLVVAQGDNALNATMIAVDNLGGMSRFVSSGAKVGLVINAPRWWTKPGSFTNPEVALAVVVMCADVGAAEIVSIIDLPGDYWGRTPRSQEFAKELTLVTKNTGEWPEIEIPSGKSLKTARVSQTLLDCDVLINLPIAKHHVGTNFSGCLKNMMGGSHRETNRFCHFGSGAKGEYDDVAFLSQCIADLNLVRKPTLCVSDATEFLLTHGPAGPGELKRARKVIVGTDPVAVDAYGVTLHDMDPTKVAMLTAAAAHGLGRLDLAALNIKEVTA